MSSLGKKERLDKLMVQRGLVPSREKAQAIIMAGMVRVDGQPARKPGQMVKEDVTIEVLGDPIPYVSRGGMKLEAALDRFSVPVRGKVCMDVGASTGGFTDCLLQRGAERVYAVDVGWGQLHWKLRRDPRVVVLERRNIRYLPKEEIPEEIDLATIDTSFISLKLVIPAVLKFLKDRAEILALIKPQFEVGKGEVERGGVVRDPQKHRRVIREIWEFVRSLGLSPQGVMESPLLGPKGNKEFFIYIKKDG
ncbi:MAG: TlyA family rRNA (cytidine-2'-O)-methyltransferase [Deltaproteobacteria bacterium]|nr:MAG: TlyA family rRNA (cytidine-2'-O)-methyltransferase [Deltaproteobacteria bacterium]